MTYEGFRDYADFAASISDGFANLLNEFVPAGAELLANGDAYSALCAVFGNPLSARRLQSATITQVERLRSELQKGCGVNLSNEDALDCLRGALQQSIGESSLDNF